MFLYRRFTRYAKRPAFAKMLAVLDEVMDSYVPSNDPNRADIAEALLQLRYDPEISLIGGEQWGFLHTASAEFTKKFAPFAKHINYLLFVYGTLKRGFPLHKYMRDATFVAEARTTPSYHMWMPSKGWYPLLTVDLKNGVAIEGELWRISEVLAVRLDQVEGRAYDRCEIELEIPEVQEPVETYLYKYEPDASMIDCGSCWLGPPTDIVL